MIISKPKFNTLFALAVFITASLAIATYGLIVLLKGTTVWWAYTLAFLFSPIALGLIIKVTWGYKIISLGSQKLEVSFPFRMKNKKYLLKQLVSWEESIVKTGSGLFKELTLRFDDGLKMTLSYHENSHYDKIFEYLSKNAAKSQRKA